MCWSIRWLEHGDYWILTKCRYGQGQKLAKNIWKKLWLRLPGLAPNRSQNTETRIYLHFCGHALNMHHFSLIPRSHSGPGFKASIIKLCDCFRYSGSTQGQWTASILQNWTVFNCCAVESIYPSAPTCAQLWTHWCSATVINIPARSMSPSWISERKPRPWSLNWFDINFAVEVC